MTNTEAESRFKHDGIWYIAAEGDSCRGCSFMSDVSECVVNGSSFDDIPYCSSVDRKDNRSVIFVKSDADNFGDEE